MLEHVSHRGTRFRCEARNLSAPIIVTNDRTKDGAIGMHPATLATEVAEFTGWYAVEIWPTLTAEGIAGFDTLVFHFE